jgi:hypothetical protein
VREAVPQIAGGGAADGLRRAAVVGVVVVGDARDGGEAAARVPGGLMLSGARGRRVARTVVVLTILNRKVQLYRITCKSSFK